MSSSLKFTEFLRLCYIRCRIVNLTRMDLSTVSDGPPTVFTYHVSVLITVRRYALHGLCDRNSVCLSARPSVTLVHCVHMVRSTIMISSPYGSPIILVSADIAFVPKFEGGHPERGRWMRVGWVRIGDFRATSRRISETVGDTTKVTIDH